MTLMLTKAAWDHPPTVVGYRRLTRRRRAWLASVGFPFLISVACLVLDLFRAASFTFLITTIALLPFFPWVTIAYFRRRRVVAVLRAYPWRELPCRLPPLVTGAPATVAITFREDFAPLFRIIPFPVLLADRENNHPGLIWFAGDPRFGGVVSPVGGHRPVRVVLDKGAGREWGGGDDALALRVGLVRRSGKATQT
ncbi:hypothetical protein ACFYRL_12280 [Streptomyces goshikiensis]|uniref:hypothetical protein n=1 Tax=Streptomyces goshikiensis TaxID=1942 RepID=UPI0036B8D37A